MSVPLHVRMLGYLKKRESENASAEEIAAIEQYLDHIGTDSHDYLRCDICRLAIADLNKYYKDRQK